MSSDCIVLGVPCNHRRFTSVSSQYHHQPVYMQLGVQVISRADHAVPASTFPPFEPTVCINLANLEIANRRSFQGIKPEILRQNAPARAWSAIQLTGDFQEIPENLKVGMSAGAGPRAPKDSWSGPEFRPEPTPLRDNSSKSSCRSLIARNWSACPGPRPCVPAAAGLAQGRQKPRPRTATIRWQAGAEASVELGD